MQFIVKNTNPKLNNSNFDAGEYCRSSPQAQKVGVTLKSMLWLGVEHALHLKMLDIYAFLRWYRYQWTCPVHTLGPLMVIPMQKAYFTVRLHQMSLKSLSFESEISVSYNQFLIKKRVCLVEKLTYHIPQIKIQIFDPGEENLKFDLRPHTTIRPFKI